MVLLSLLPTAAEWKQLLITITGQKNPQYHRAVIVLNIPVLMFKKYPSFILWFAHGVYSPFPFDLIA